MGKLSALNKLSLRELLKKEEELVEFLFHKICGFTTAVGHSQDPDVDIVPLRFYRDELRQVNKEILRRFTNINKQVS